MRVLDHYICAMVTEHVENTNNIFTYFLGKGFIIFKQIEFCKAHLNPISVEVFSPLIYGSVMHFLVAGGFIGFGEQGSLSSQCMLEGFIYMWPQCLDLLQKMA